MISESIMILDVDLNMLFNFSPCNQRFAVSSDLILFPSANKKVIQTMQFRRLQDNNSLPINSLSQRNTIRFSTLTSQINRPEPSFTESNSPNAGSDRKILPKFKTQENSPVSKRKGSNPKFHFPELVARQNNPSKYTLHNINMDQMRSKVANLDSIYKFFKNDEDMPKLSKKNSKKTQEEDFNEFIEMQKEKRNKRPKIIKNEITRIFLSSQEKQRKKKTSAYYINNVLSQKIGKEAFDYANHPYKIANQFLPKGKDELNKLITLRYNKN